MTRQHAHASAHSCTPTYTITYAHGCAQAAEGDTGRADERSKSFMCGGEADRGAHVAVCDAWRRQDKSAGLLRPCTPYAVCLSTHAVCVCGMSTSARSQFVRAAEVLWIPTSLCVRASAACLCVDVLVRMRSVYLFAQGLVVRCSKIPHCNVVSRLSVCLPSSLAKRFVLTRMTRAPMSMNM